VGTDEVIDIGTIQDFTPNNLDPGGETKGLTVSHPSEGTSGAQQMYADEFSD
jgi:hypothetical protein